MYLYDSEDNAPMSEDAWEAARMFAAASLGAARMFAEASAREPTIAEDSVPFTDLTHDNGCWNCQKYDGNRCMKHWNNAEPEYYIPDRDDKGPDDICDDWSFDRFAEWSEYHDS